jgi:hypothetical protein
MNDARRWLFEPATTRSWWLDSAAARVIAWQGDSMRVLAELPSPAHALVRLDEHHLLALGEHQVLRVNLDDGRHTSLPLDPTRKPSVDAELIGLGPSSFAWIEPGGLSLHMFELHTQIGCVLWPTEPRVAHHGPRVAVDAERRRLAWCHVVDAIDLIDLEHGGPARALGSRPAAISSPSAAVLPTRFTHGLWFDRAGTRVAAAFTDETGVQLRIHACDREAAVEPEHVTLTATPGRLLSLEIDLRVAIVAHDLVAERVSFDAAPVSLPHALGPIVAACVHDRRIGLGDDAGRCQWIEEGDA